jgi:transcriptional regulator with XRE-family HTH domain
MNMIEQDLAKRVILLRKINGFKRQTIVDKSGLTLRTIEKIESGRHRADTQTLRSIARGFGVDVAVFRKPSPEEEIRDNASMAKAVYKTAVVPTNPVRSARDLLAAFGWSLFRFDMAQVDGDRALEIASEIGDWVTDLNDGWNDISHADRLQSAHSFAELCQRLGTFGYVCHMGRHRQQIRVPGASLRVLFAGVVSIMPTADSEDTRYAIVHLEGGWEVPEEDRPVPTNAAW